MKNNLSSFICSLSLVLLLSNCQQASIVKNSAAGVDPSTIGGGGGEPLNLVSAVSRKTHASKGTFDIPLNLNASVVGLGPVAAPATECRIGEVVTNSARPLVREDYLLVFTMDQDVANASVSLSEGKAEILDTPTIQGKQVFVRLSNVEDAQELAIKLDKIMDRSGRTLEEKVVYLRILVGDVDGNGMVNREDVDQVKAVSGTEVTEKNFRRNVTTDGSLDSSDISLVKAHLGNSL